MGLVARLTKAREAKVLGFVNARKYAEAFAFELSLQPHLEKSVFVHYSSLDKHVRRKTEAEFAKKRTAVCFATSTLELGIDIGDIDAVMLLGVPKGIASFLQRIGRGSRRENKVNVVCFTGADSFLEDNPPRTTAYRGTALRHADRLGSERGELPTRHRYEIYGAVAQQCLSVIAARKGKYTSLKDLSKLFEHLGYVSEEALGSILARLTGNYLIRHQVKNQYGAGELLHKLVDDKRIYGNFSCEHEDAQDHP